MKCFIRFFQNKPLKAIFATQTQFRHTLRMAQQNQFVIKRRNRLVLSILLVCGFMAYNFGGNIYELFGKHRSLSPTSVYSFVMNLFLAGVSVAIAVYAVKKSFDKSPGLIINNMGVVDNSGLVSAGLVLWKDVVEVNKSRVIFTECIMLKVKNPERYIANQKNPFKRMWLSMENKRIGSPVNISASGLHYKYNDLFRVIQDKYLSSHVESRTYELKREKDTILREKSELLDSINYAKRIQNALLPSTSVIESRIGENFILYLPKNIVSGDFYWVEAIGDYVVFAVCDCTGHGVPGALINIVCTNALNRAVKEYGILEPGKILDKVSELITDSIGLDGEVRDGMDASVCSFNKITRELTWAGANIPLWVARHGVVYEMLEFKPDKQSVGLTDDRQPFNTHKIDIQKGDILYMASDGYADQFGGELGKKMTRKKFKEVLLLQKGKSLNEQKENLLAFHNEYKKNGEQIDDILVMGIRIEK